MANLSKPGWTNHADIRSKQRGVKKEAVEAVWEYADREEPCGDGCFILSISHRNCCWLVQKGMLQPKLVEHVSRLKLIVSGDTLLTVYKNDN